MGLISLLESLLAVGGVQETQRVAEARGEALGWVAAAHCSTFTVSRG